MGGKYNLQNNPLGLKKKVLIQNQLAIKVGINICSYTIHKIINNALDYGKHMTYMQK